MLLVLVKPGRILQSIFRSSQLVFLGAYSYAIYVFHYGIFGLCRYAILGDVPSIHNWTTFWVTNLALGITFLCAAISRRFVEHRRSGGQPPGSATQEQGHEREPTERAIERLADGDP